MAAGARGTSPLLSSMRLLLFAVTVLCQVTTGGSSNDEAEGQEVVMVTHHGVASGASLHTQGEAMLTKSQLNEPTGGMPTKKQDHQSKLDQLKGGPASRRKRFKSKAWRTWPKAIVPYVIDMNSTGEHYRDEAYAAFTRYHKYTCIRFVPLVKGQMTALYGLKNDAHMIIEKAKGCVAYVGFLNDVTGQGNSCCGRGACTHELGHVLGLSHEQQSPLRGEVMSIDWRYGHGEAKANPTTSISYHYDWMNPMHYGGAAFKFLYEDLRPLWGLSAAWFLYKDVSLMHDCKGLHCSSFSQECHHDGFVTLVDDKCSCLCAAGLDPATGCQTTIKTVTHAPKWPAGSYALLASKAGCPGDSGVFTSGSWQHKGKGHNSKSDEFNLGGSYLADTFTHNFCVKAASSGDAGPKWETGRYCILRVNGKCPEGFKTGHLQFDDADDSPQVKTGTLPDGTFSTDTRLEFCCRDDGWLSTPLSNLPNTKPLMLFTSPTQWNCQEIEGMRWTKEYMYFDGYKANAGSSEHRAHTQKGTTFKIWYCHYYPISTYNCGGETHLTLQNRKAVITSPGYPAPYGTNLECNWLITAPKDGRIFLKFSALKMTGLVTDCQDSLEIRYNMPPQPGVRYCGDGLSRTFRSINNTVILTLRSDHHHVPTDNGFSVTASLHIPETDDCYVPFTKGVFYRGPKNYTRSMRRCLPWAEVMHCLKDHSFRPSDFGRGLDENYCRNPDNTAMPWCYTGTDCNRDYCDVCNLEPVYDRLAYCTAATCANKTSEQIIAAGCAGTCNLQQPPAPIKAQTCGPPSGVSDASITNRQGQVTPTTYHVGARVTYKCNTGPESLYRFCFSTGQWSTLGYVCGSCCDSWAYYKGACYKHYEDFRTWASAKQRCDSHPGASLLRVNNELEQNFTSQLRFNNMLDVWVGAKDEKKETEWLWEDGSKVTWNVTWNTKSKQPRWHTRRNCARMTPDYNGNKWQDEDCKAFQAFTCKYPLSARKICADRLPDCPSVLLKYPDTCTKHPVYASHQCPFTCGVCQPASATPLCDITPTSSDVILESPKGVTTVPRGTLVRYSCRTGYELTQGYLQLVCGKDGKLFGQLPVCKDPSTVVQDSNDAELQHRSRLSNTGVAVTSLGSSWAIRRHGVIKQWRFFSPQPGWVHFHVWRPHPAGANFSYVLAGMNQIWTSGIGEETQDVPEEDWIRVQPGDSLGLWEPGSSWPRAYLSYDDCDPKQYPGDYGVTTANSGREHGDYSPIAPMLFSRDLKCRRYSFKAVIHPLNTVPPTPRLVTSQRSLMFRGPLGSKRRAYVGDSASYLITAYGVVSQWQFYVKHSGSAAFQVWRRRADQGVRRFEFIGENVLKNLTVAKGQKYTYTVPADQRIAVKTGDLIGLYYAEDRLGIPYSRFYYTDFPEADNVYSLSGPKGTFGAADTFGKGTVYEWSDSSYYRCLLFSLRAVITQNKAAEDSECFDPASKGKLYRGLQDLTRSMKPCLTWTQVTHCPHHTFNPSDFGAGLDKNYCRNPDNQLEKPWCYTDQQCNREYCDVCNDAKVHDTVSSCTTGGCAGQTRYQQLAAGCAATCNVKAAPAPVRAQKCGLPGSLPDAAITPPSSQQTYSVGDTVTYTCKAGSETLTRTCLSDGNFSPAGYVCSKTCGDHASDCRSILQSFPYACVNRTDYARHQCPYSCGLCNPSGSTACPTQPKNAHVKVALPAGQATVTRGTVVEHACHKDYFLISGQLSRVCGKTGELIGTAPVCEQINCSATYCYNGGHKADINNKCTCICPAALEPSTGCTTTIKTDGCGGEVTLTKKIRQAVLTSPNYPAPYDVSKECHWLVKAAEPGGRVLVNFNTMKVTPNGNDCQDSLEVRSGQPNDAGKRYCGSRIANTIRSINDTVIVTLRSDGSQVASDTGFSLTATLFIPEEEECYKPSSRGVQYREQKDYTRNMELCRNWTEVTHCPHHAFNPSDFGDGLDKNYCRNPDNSEQPWCYVDAKCQREFCDVCNNERVFDKSASCSASDCQKSREDILGAGCANTCTLQPPAAPSRGQKCGLPGSLPDAAITPPSSQQTYSVGDTVTYTCKTGSETLTRTCLSDGKFSPAGYVCGGCQVGWSINRSACYRYTKDSASFLSARKTCSDDKALVSPMMDALEQTFTLSLRDQQVQMWNGASDMVKEGTFVWEDGTAVGWTNWNDKEPNDYYGEDCTMVKESKKEYKWYDVGCGSKQPFVCKYQLSAKTTCVDRHPDCVSVLLAVPDMCSKHPAFASHQCSYSCGLCQAGDTPGCATAPPSGNKVKVVSPSNQATVARGSTVLYACEQYYFHGHGHMLRACGKDGHLIGPAPVCVEVNCSASHCYNGGSKTKVKDACTCLCPPGLDPSTGCTTSLTTKPCGGETTLTRQSLTAQISSPNFPTPYAVNLDCTYVIKADEPGAIVLINFEELKLTSQGGVCQDWLEIRHTNLWSAGTKYCGDAEPQTLFTGGTAVLTLRSDAQQAALDTGFRLTASLYHPENDKCYAPASKGSLYRGLKDYTLDMKPCLPWSNVTNCPHHPFNPSDYGAGLDKNYCRNPDNSAAPWCYVDTQCNKGTCDVCNIERRVYDTASSCPDVCSKTRAENLAAGCAATCGVKHPAAPIRAQKCGQPGNLPDAAITPPPSQQSYSVGDTVTYTCKAGSETLTRTCLSDGKFSPAGYVCGACQAGWTVDRSACYRYTQEPASFLDARKTCANGKALVSPMLDALEQTFTLSLRDQPVQIWNGASDMVKEGTFVWEDGTAIGLGWTNWNDNEPNNHYNEDCTVVKEDNKVYKWNDIGCGRKRSFVCKYKVSAKTTCVDRHPDCVSVLLAVPDMCSKHPAFASHQCSYSCGLCQASNSSGCATAPSSGNKVKVVSPSNQATVARGSTVLYACEQYYFHSHGHMLRACGKDGHLIGPAPVCVEVNCSASHCYNGGSKTKVKDACTCLCPPGLDPSTGCTTSLTTKPCGGETTLTRQSLTAQVSSPNFPTPYAVNLDCTYVIKADEPGAIVLINFEELKLTSQGGVCQDWVEIRHTNLWSAGAKYCGDAEPQTLFTGGTAVLTLRSDAQQAALDTGFRLTASLYHPENDKCYAPASKGSLYRGLKDYTLDMKPCLPWSNVTNCPHHPFNPSDYGAGLDKNYCRNPDNSAAPWCYVDTQCNKGTCDVCNIERRVYDTASSCPSEVCSKTRAENLAAGCAATCGVKHPAAPIRAQKCGQPGSLPDAAITPPPSQQSYSVGDTVTYTCKAGSETLTRTCLSDGKFSPAGYVCGACQAGWTMDRSACYRYTKEPARFLDARKTCADGKALVSPMLDALEQTFTLSLRDQQVQMWNGASDMVKEGTFVWEDGTAIALGWTNWNDNEPNNHYNEDCTVVKENNKVYKWNDIGCGRKRSFVCKYKVSAKTTCVDRHPDCVSVLLAVPDMCSKHPAFASHQCSYSCGLCQASNSSGCATAPSSGNKVKVVSPSNQATVARGSTVLYACEQYYFHSHGHMLRACGKDGHLIGPAPVCVEVNCSASHCYNGGSKTKVKDACTCLCPPGLDPSTGCTTSLTTKPCGGETTLIRQSLTAQVSSPNFPTPYAVNLDCTYVIKADEPGAIVLINFEELKLTSQGGVCQDWLEIRHTNLWSAGAKYCGDAEPQTLFTGGTAVLTLRSDAQQAALDTGFRLTASLYHPENDKCYAPASKGSLYRGLKDYTLDMKPCLPWSNVTNCPHHPFNPSDYGAGLDKNYCRNPDNSAAPWCYVDTQCNKGTCDVCNIERRVYDTASSCPSEVCSKTRAEILAAGCAATCGVKHPAAPIRAQKCGQPGSLPDAAITPPPSQQSYSVGDTVTYTCKAGSETLTRTCLSDGKFSPAGYVCGACQAGWTMDRSACYRYTKEPARFLDARKTCADGKALVSPMLDALEQTFTLSLRDQQVQMWNGASDMVKEGTFVWEDGTAIALGWTNWNDKEPNDYYGEDCTMVKESKKEYKWYDVGCGSKQPFVCKYQLSAKTTCIDRHPDCVSVLLANPDMCSKHPAFASHQCSDSCGLCQAGSNAKCTLQPQSSNVKVVSPTGQATVNRGSTVQYACKYGFTQTSGQNLLACGKDGNFIGTVPVCAVSSCGQPDAVADATLVQPSGQPVPSSYSIGATVTYQCSVKTGTVTRTCQGDGQWSAPGDDCKACPAGWSEDRSACYRFYATPKSATDAYMACHALKGFVASMKDAAEQTFVMALRTTEIEIWIGLYDIATEGTFVFSDGSPLLWKNWAKGEPNNYGNEDCVIVRKKDGVYKWNDFPCTQGHTKPYVCKYSF